MWILTSYSPFCQQIKCDEKFDSHAQHFNGDFQRKWVAKAMEMEYKDSGGSSLLQFKANLIRKIFENCVNILLRTKRKIVGDSYVSSSIEWQMAICVASACDQHLALLTWKLPKMKVPSRRICDVFIIDGMCLCFGCCVRWRSHCQTSQSAPLPLLSSKWHLHFTHAIHWRNA